MWQSGSVSIKGDEMELVRLSEIDKGEGGIIRKVNASGVMMQKLLNMGIVKGEAIEVVELAPFGSPIECKIGGVNVSLRREEAERILIERR